MFYRRTVKPVLFLFLVQKKTLFHLLKRKHIKFSNSVFFDFITIVMMKYFHYNETVFKRKGRNIWILLLKN